MEDKVKPELLAPVGNWEMCLAAVHNGADAIYLGMPGFNARGRAKTFSLDELKEIIEFCHLYGVKVFLAFNVLIFEREIKECAKLLADVLPLAPDALIVQDIGLVRLIKEMAPNQIVHASTQMTITSHEAISEISDLKIKRVVVGREVSIPEIRRIREHTAVEIETFVHGALCVAYSGQCLTSEALGGRSANRGQCAQACRLAYDLIVDGEERELGDRRYLVSPKDLCGLDDVEELISAGVNSFKIEGRLKSAEYVASTVKNYRERIDSPKDSQSNSSAVAELKLAYARDFFSGWLHGVNHQKLVDGRYSQHHGIEAGEILSISPGWVKVKSSYHIQPGDGVLFAHFKNNFESGAKVFEVREQGNNSYALSFANSFDLSKLSAGMRLFINSSDSHTQRLKSSYHDKNRLKKIPVLALLNGAVGEPLTLTLIDALDNSVSVQSESTLLVAKQAPLTSEFLKAEIGALGGTPFSLAHFESHVVGALFIHQREIKELRRRATQRLEALQKEREAVPLLKLEAVNKWIDDQYPKIDSQVKAAPALHILIREMKQIDALKGLSLGVIYLDFEFGKDYTVAVQKLREMGHKIGIATTRILKPGETAHLKVIERLEPDVVLIRNLGALHYFRNKGLPLVADFSLNITNSLTAQWYESKGVLRLCPSYDLKAEQLFELLGSSDPSHYEVTVHQYIPEFHMEHCVFAAFLSKGSSFRDCGRPCEKYRVELRDNTGNIHPLKADAECRNTMFSGKAQSAARSIAKLVNCGVGNFRVEALYESPQELRQKIESYLALLNGQSAPLNTLSQLGVVEKYGVTEGQLYNIRSWKDRKKSELPSPTLT